jgi:hypothetical protein
MTMRPDPESLHGGIVREAKVQRLAERVEVLEARTADLVQLVSELRSNADEGS